jgi:hypothetical protein
MLLADCSVTFLALLVYLQHPRPGGAFELVWQKLEIELSSSLHIAALSFLI